MACFRRHKEAQCTTPKLLSDELDAQREKQRAEQRDELRAAEEGADGAQEPPHKRPHTAEQHQQQQQQKEEDVLFKPRETESTYTVSEAQLRALWRNGAVVEALRDPRLQRLLCDIDRPRDPRQRERALDEATAASTDFAAFVNTVLQTVGVRDIEGNCTLT